MNSADWWRRHWERYPDLDVEIAEPLPHGWDLWIQWHEFLQASGLLERPEDDLRELQQLRDDGGRYLGFVRMAARRKGAQA